MEPTQPSTQNAPAGVASPGLPTPARLPVNASRSPQHEIEIVQNDTEVEPRNRDDKSHSHSHAVAAPPRVIPPQAGSVSGTEETPLEDATIALEVRGFNAYYGDFQAIHNIDMDIPQNRVTAFIGPSGCGKSTFLRWINRMNDLIGSARATGSLVLHGTDLLQKSLDVVDLRRRVGMVFQKPNPFPKSIYENVAFGPRLHTRIKRRDLDDLVEHSLRQAALWDEVKDRLKSSALGLSGGQQQRLCIARAIAVGPEIMLMDEPCSALDPKSTLRIEELIAELRDKYTIIIVTHNMQQAARVSDVTSFFYEGQLVESGPTERIFTRPENQQTEDYVCGRFG